MPDRIIRDELLTSERYWSVSPEARNLYLAVLLSADDMGRYTGSSFALRTKCMAGTVSHERIEKLLLELVDTDLVRIYQHDDARYIFVPRYRQRLRFPTSRFPEPPNEINDITENKSVSSPSQARLKTDSSLTQDGLKSAEVKRREEKRREETPSAVRPKPEPNPMNVKTWEAYAAAYVARYRAPPVRNAKVNGNIAQLVKRLGEESPDVAAFFVTHNDQFYVKKRHPVSLLLSDAEGLRTQWKTGKRATGLEARSAERIDSVAEQLKRLKESHDA